MSYLIYVFLNILPFSSSNRLKMASLLVILAFSFIIGVSTQDQKADISRLFTGDLREYCQGEDSTGCLNCKEGVKCSLEGGAPEMLSCPGDMICGRFCGTYPACHQFYDSAVIADNTACFCRDALGFISVNGDYADPFSDTSYIRCTDGTAEFLSCAEGLSYSESLGCFEPPECLAADTKLEIPGSCSKYMDCPAIGDPAIVDCLAATPFFDAHYSECVDPLTKSCVGQTNGFFTDDASICTVGHVCDSDSAKNTYCCDRGSHFDGSEYGCVDGSCTNTGSFCIKEYWENAKCGDGKCVNDGDTYATHDDCSPYYFECQSNGSGGFDIALEECPDILPLYDPTTGFCSATVTGC